MERDVRPPATARVLVIAGPSGSGKSRLARRLHAAHGWPLLALDDFYHDVTAPGLPMSPLGLVDWDDVRSWNLEAAVDTLESLCREHPYNWNRPFPGDYYHSRGCARWSTQIGETSSGHSRFCLSG